MLCIMDTTVQLTRVVIPSRDADLAGLLYEPVQPADTTVVLAHGLTGSKESLDVLANYLCTRGWRCITFDFRGHKLGGSTGQMRSAQDALEDVVAVVRYVKRRHMATRVVLGGHSMGGSVALVAAAEDEAIVGVAVLGSGCSGASGFNTPAGRALMSQRGDYVSGAPASVIMDDIARLCRDRSRPLNKPTLFVAARGDILVRLDTVQRLATQHAPYSQFVAVDGAHMELPFRARGHLADWLDSLRT